MKKEPEHIQLRAIDFLDLLYAVRDGTRLPRSIEERVLANVFVKAEFYENLQTAYVSQTPIPRTAWNPDHLISEVEKELGKRNIESGRLIIWEEGR